jgi:hypothetical protein
MSNPFANIFYMTNTYFPWKGRTFTQVASAIQLNQNNAKNLTPRQLRLPLPLKIYRRELAVYGGINTNTPNSVFVNSRRISNKIDYMNMPGSTVVNTKNNKPIGICDTVDINIPNNMSVLPGTCNTICNSQTCITDQACNARKRVRSAGMIKRAFNPNKNNASYCTNTNQYLISRSLSYSTNEFAYMRQGNPSLTPGPGAAKNNLYSTGGLSYCNMTIIKAGVNNIIKYVWIDNVIYTITIPDGSYTFESFVSVFNGGILTNKTYFLNTSSNQIVSLLSLAYDNINNLIILQSFNGNVDKYLNSSYNCMTLKNTIVNSSLFSLNIPYYIIPPNGIRDILGFADGNYNQLPATSSVKYVQSVSNQKHSLNPNYATANYKPSNSKFAQQGAVSSSAGLLRKKYDTIMTSANKTSLIFGNAAANAIAYGISEQPYSIKSQLGYKDNMYPYVNGDKVVCISDKSNCHK